MAIFKQKSKKCGTQGMPHSLYDLSELLFKLCSLIVEVEFEFKTLLG